MIAESDVLFEIDVVPRYWRDTQRIACYRAFWKEKDCFFLVSPKHLTFPMTVEKLSEHACLVLTAVEREVVLDRYFDEDGKSLQEAVGPYLDVEYVHAL